LPTHFNYTRTRSTLRKVDISLAKLEQLSSLYLENEFIRLIDSAIGWSCPEVCHALIEAITSQMTGARFYMRELEQLEGIIGSINQSHKMLQTLNNQLRDIEKLQMKLGMYQDASYKPHNFPNKHQ
jgi:hypothetical protein